MAQLKSVAAADLELLRKYDTPTICNVIELFDIRPRTAGYMDGRIRACFPEIDRKSTRLNSSHIQKSRMPSSA